MELTGKSVVVVGLGRTGAALARFLKTRGASVLVSDMAAESALGDQVQPLREMGLSLELGGHRPESFARADLIVLSPGVPHTIIPVKQAQANGVAVMGEIELASRFIREPIIAVTGTNGKTTTTELLGRMLKNSDLDVFVGGNIGNPLIGYVDRSKPADVIVAEISSFQLDTSTTFRPKIGVLLNISDDHLDRYPNFEAYAESKIRLFANQQKDDIAVLNKTDPIAGALTRNLVSTKLFFPETAEDEAGASINGKSIILKLKDPNKNDDKFRIHRLDLSGLKLKGRHNLENVCAAAVAALAADGRPEGIQAAIDQFTGLPHRLEYIARIGDVEYYNDSKATNVDAVRRALECFDQPVVLIMGGLDKGGNFNLLREILPQRTKQLIVMGQAAGLIQTALGDTVATTSAATMADAVNLARRAASAGNVVLLAPGCASFDMYANYAQRGEDFRKEVTRLK